jgi:hypothetical protein
MVAGIANGAGAGIDTGRAEGAFMPGNALLL